MPRTVAHPIGAAAVASPVARPAGSEAERQAARALAARLALGGRREVRLEPHWVRPGWQLVGVLHALLGIAGSLVATSAPAVGLGLALAAVVSVALDARGWWVLRRLTPERATQNVVASGAVPEGASPMRVILTAACDTPRGGVVRRAALRRLADGGGIALGLGPLAWFALALLVIAACAGARFAGTDGLGVGIVQLVPTVGLLVAIGLLVDSALAPAAAPDDSALSAVLSIAAALDDAPPRRIAVDVVLAGAGSVGALGFLAHLRVHRPAAERTVVLEVGPCAAGAPRWWTADGSLMPLRFHPRLLALCAEVAGRDPALGATARRGRGVGAGLRARQRRLPAVRIGTDVGQAHTDAGAGGVAATTAFALALVAALDADLG